MPRILIVDDSRYQRNLVEKALHDVGRCEQADNGAMAVRLFQEALHQGESYDLVVMDILMPVMDGHRALSWIRRMEQQAGVQIGRAHV